MRFIALFFLLAISLAAGQSLLSNASTGASITAANVPDDQDLRLEFQVHDWSVAPSTQTIAWLSFFDLQVISYPEGGGTLRIKNQRSPLSECAFSGMGARPNVLVRVQVSVAEARMDCEMWDVDGSNYTISTRLLTLSSSTTANGSFPTFANGAYRIGFMRGWANSLVPLRSRPPVTADVGNYFDWKFDGNGNDSSGNSRTVNTSAQTFAETPTTLPSVIISVPGSPSGIAFKPLRAGHPSLLDCGNSYSMADASSAVTCYWQQIPHADGEALTSRVIFDDRTSETPSLTDLVFGPYRFRLTVTDSDGVQNSTEAAIGAVAYGDNGVVIYPDERLNILLGPSTVVGSNPWTYLDHRFDSIAREIADGWVVNGGTWENPATKNNVNGFPLEGTVYWSGTQSTGRTFYGIGTQFTKLFCGGQPGPANGDFIIPYVPDANWWGASEQALPRNLPFFVRSCVSDTEIVVDRYLESGSTITVDSPGVVFSVWDHNNWPSAIQGTAYIDNGSATLHGAGTDFQTFFCDGGATPAAGASVQLPNGSGTLSTYAISSCASATEVTLTATFTGTTIDAPGGAYIPRKTGPSMGTWSTTGTTNVNFYDNALALYRHYYATGDYRSLKAARYIVANYFRVPHLVNGYGTPGVALYFPVVSPVLAAVVDSEKAWGAGINPWPFLANWARQATSAKHGKAPGDQRESAYAGWFLSLVARFHPDASVRNELKALVVSKFWDQKSKYQDPESGGYYNYYVNFDNSRSWQVTNGSTVATLNTGANIDETYCGVFETTAGTISIDANGVDVTGTGTALAGMGGEYIILKGTLGGTPHIEISRISSSPSPTNTVAKLDFPWRGDVGSVSEVMVHDSNTANSSRGYPIFMMENVTSLNGLKDPRGIALDDIYTCSYVDSTHLELFPAYRGNTDAGDIYRRMVALNMYTYTPVFRQPFMDGLTASSMAAAAEALRHENYDLTTAAGFMEKMGEVLNAQWNDRDTVTGGQSYFRMAPTCKPYDFSTPTFCDGSTSPSGTERDFWIETILPLGTHYLETLATGSSEEIAAELARNDQIMATTYSVPGWETPVAGDGYYSTWLANATWKTLGQAFGHGGGLSWPAARLGGPTAPEDRTLTVQVASPLTYGDRIRITAINASGVSVTNTCQAATCSVTSDFRAGGQSVLIEYLNASSVVLSTATQNLIVN